MNEKEKRLFKSIFFIFLPMFGLMVLLDRMYMHRLANFVHLCMIVLFFIYYFRILKYCLIQMNNILNKIKRKK